MSSPWPTTTDLTKYQSGDAQMSLDMAIDAIKGYCGWHIAPSIEAEITIDGSNHFEQPLPTLHLTALTSVTEDGVAIDLTNVDWSESGVMTKRSGFWTYKKSGLVVNMTHGYDEIPMDLMGVALGIATLAQTPSSAASSQSAGPYSIQLTTRAGGAAGGLYIPKDMADILGRYKLWGMA